MWIFEKACVHFQLLFMGLVVVCALEETRGNLVGWPAYVRRRMRQPASRPASDHRLTCAFGVRRHAEAGVLNERAPGGDTGVEDRLLVRSRNPFSFAFCGDAYAPWCFALSSEDKKEKFATRC